MGKGSTCLVKIIQVRCLNFQRDKPILTGRICSLRSDHEYVRGELQDMAEQMDMERRLVGEATWWTLVKEMWMIPGNRKRALISIGLMVCQQITGTNTLARISHAYQVSNADHLQIIDKCPELLCTSDILGYRTHRAKFGPFRDRGVRPGEDAFVSLFPPLRSRQSWAP